MPKSACLKMLNTEQQKEAALKSKSSPLQTFSFIAKIITFFILRQYRL
jgi:hypothetical protein